MKKEQIQTLKDTVKLLRRGYKPCSDFTWGCLTCQRYVAIDLLEDIIAFEEWWLNNKGYGKQINDRIKKFYAKPKK